MYDPKIARFLQEDTVRGNINDPLSLNLYTYVSNNPLIYYDPTGHTAENLYSLSKLVELNGGEVVWNKYTQAATIFINGRSKTYEVKKSIMKDNRIQISLDNFKKDFGFHQNTVLVTSSGGFSVDKFAETEKQKNAKSTTEVRKNDNVQPAPQQNKGNPVVEFFKGLFTMNDAGKALVDDFNRRMMEVNAQDFLAIRNKYLSNEYMHGVDITNPEVQKEADKIALAMLMMGPSSNMELMTNMLSSQAISLQVQKWGQQYTDFFEGLDNVDVYKTITNKNNPSMGVVSAKTLFRGERSSVTPDVAFSQGFKPKGTHDSLEQHVTSNTTAGNFVSTSSDKGIAQQFAGKNGYVYEIKTSNYIDVNSTLGAKAPFPEQMEFSIPGGVKPSEIKGAWVMKNGVLTGEYISNPGYKGVK